MSKPNAVRRLVQRVANAWPFMRKARHNELVHELRNELWGECRRIADAAELERKRNEEFFDTLGLIKTQYLRDEKDPKDYRLTVRFTPEIAGSLDQLDRESLWRLGQMIGARVAKEIAAAHFIRPYVNKQATSYIVRPSWLRDNPTNAPPDKGAGLVTEQSHEP